MAGGATGQPDCAAARDDASSSNSPVVPATCIAAFCTTLEVLTIFFAAVGQWLWHCVRFWTTYCLLKRGRTMPMCTGRTHSNQSHLLCPIPAPVHVNSQRLQRKLAYLLGLLPLQPERRMSGIWSVLTGHLLLGAIAVFLLSQCVMSHGCAFNERI